MALKVSMKPLSEKLNQTKKQIPMEQYKLNRERGLWESQKKTKIKSVNDNLKLKEDLNKIEKIIKNIR